MCFINDIYLVSSVIWFCIISCDSRSLSSPCPKVFEYERQSNGDVIGYIQIASGQYLDEITTVIKYSLAVLPPKPYSSSIKPVNTLQDYNNGKTLVYKVIFPISDPVPEVTAIEINGQNVCFAYPQHEVVSITQTHKMKVTVTVKSSNGDTQVVKKVPQSSTGDESTSDKISSLLSEFEGHGLPADFTGLGDQSTSDKISSLLAQFEGHKFPSDISTLFDKFGQDGDKDTQTFIFGQGHKQTEPNDNVPNGNTETSYPVTQPAPMVPQSETPWESYQVPVTTTPTPVQTSPPTKPPLTTTPATTTRQPSTPFPKDCGLRGDASVALIYYGNGYTRGDWPWLVAMYRKVGVGNVFTCAGALVTSIHVVSAAHCMRNQHSTFAQKDIFLKIGAFNLDHWSDRYLEIRALESARIHDDFDTVTLANDILVMTLDREVQFNQYIRPVCLWKGSTNIEEIIGKRGYVAGWGKSELGNPGTGEPRVLRLPIVSTSQCRGVKQDFFKLTSDKTLCAGDRNGSGPCIGDSGGGMYIHREGRWQLRGIVSLSLPDNTGQERLCNPDEYAVFTDVAQYMPWVINAIASYYLK